MARSVGTGTDNWRTADGRNIPILDLGDEHLKNIAKRFLSKGLDIPYNINQELNKRGFDPKEFKVKKIINLSESILRLEKENKILHEEIRQLKILLEEQKWKVI